MAGRVRRLSRAARPWRRQLVRVASRAQVVLALGLTGCASSEIGLRVPSDGPLDAVIVPGCPTRPDGQLSGCLVRRAAWGALLWSRGVTRSFIVSGAATYNRYVEAEALAAGLVALGVPPAVIWLETDARHTDENMYYALRVAHRLGAKRIAVASDGGQAAGGCSFIHSWGEACLAAPLDAEALSTWLDEARERAIDAVRLVPVPASGWLPVDAFERQRAAHGGPERPGSLALYFWYAPLGRLFRKPWVPIAPPERPLVRYDAYLATHPLAS